MTGFEPGSSGIGCDCIVKCATTTDRKQNLLPNKSKNNPIQVTLGPVRVNFSGKNYFDDDEDMLEEGGPSGSGEIMERSG